MRDLEKKTYKKPEQHSSQGHLREGMVRRERDGADHLTGYRPREQEGVTRPREAGRLENSFGDIAVGTNRKKELMILLSRRRTQEGLAVRADEKELRGESARKMTQTRGSFLTNTHDEKESAVAYRQSHRKAPQMMLNQFRTMMEKRDQQTAKNQMAFLSRREEKAELKALRQRELTLRAQGGTEARSALRAIERRREELRQILADKETQERCMRQVLQKAGEEAERRSEESWERPFVFSDQWQAEAEEDGGGEPRPEDEQGNNGVPGEDQNPSEGDLSKTIE